MSVLVIVPCGRRKVWNRHTDVGPTRADEAYIGAPFVVNRTYAGKFGDSWMVLSAKHGFVQPHTEIPGPYEVRFGRASPEPISVEALRRQIEEFGLDTHSLVVVLGGRHYREITKEAFAGLSPRLTYPFAGLPIGKMMQATKRAIATGAPGFAETETSNAGSGSPRHLAI